MSGSNSLPFLSDNGTVDLLYYNNNATGASVVATGSTTARTLGDRFAEVANVKDFGAVGDGVTDDTAAIQAAINVGGTVVIPSGTYKITSSVTLGNVLVYGIGSPSGPVNAEVIIYATGNFPAFQSVSTTPHVSFELENLYIKYGDTVPTNQSTDGNKIGIYFPDVYYPQLVKITNVTVKGAWYAFYENATSNGSYQCIFERVLALNCRTGFYKIGGTTTKFDTCYVLGGIQGFYIKNALAMTLLNCAVDQLNTTGLSSYSFGNYFSNVSGLSIIGFDFESNVIVGSGHAFLYFTQTNGTVQSISGYNNTIGCSTGQEVYFIQSDSSSSITFINADASINSTNFPPVPPNTSNLNFTGNGGSGYTVAAINNSKITAFNSNFPNSVAVSGSTPTAVYGVAGNSGTVVYCSNSTVGTSANAVYQYASTQTGTFTPALGGFTTTGTVTATGNYVRTGNQVTFWINLATTGTIASTAGTSYLTLSNIGIAPIQPTTVTVSDNSVANTGVGYVNTAGLAYTPTWTASVYTKTIFGSFIENTVS